VKLLRDTFEIHPFRTEFDKPPPPGPRPFLASSAPKTLLLSSKAGAPVLRGLKRKRRLPPERLRRSAVHLHPPPHRRPRLLHPTILCKIDPNPTILDPFGNRGFGLPGPMPVLLVRSCAAGDQVRKRHPRVRSLLQLPRHPGFFFPVALPCLFTVCY